MILKYDVGVTPFRGKVKGAVYQPYASGQQATSLKRNGRKRYSNQWNSSGILIQLVRTWKTLSVAQQTAWNDWAIANPHATIHNPTKNWNGYQYFLVRNYYELLFKGRDTAVFIPPDNTNVTNIKPSFEIFVYFGIISVIITARYPINPYSHGIFLTRVNSPGAIYPATTPVYMDYFEVPNSPDVYTYALDVSIPYYRNFGAVPVPGDWIYIKYRNPCKYSANVYVDKFFHVQFQSP